jgi:hypothetical protein
MFSVVHMTQSSARTGIENDWYAITGRVIAVKVEADGDLHLALQEATGDKPGGVVCEIPAKPQWCELRTTVFSWTHTKFPFHTSSTKELKLDHTPVIPSSARLTLTLGMLVKINQTDESISPATLRGKFIPS